ncbi:MAG: RecX family transcriptional regulator [Muribaculaceae bacterium]|nr:RecX family transcriptional regulator [Muribaculaceae bacterium]
MIRKKPITKEAALLRMADLCARGERCASEIREKLRKLMVPSSTANEIIEYLEENRYIDDLRFAKAYARDKVRFSGWGRNKIRMALAVKRISSSEIREALDELDEEEYLLSLTKAAEAKARTLDLTDYADRAKLYRHLASRGFESGLISKAIREIQE